MTISGFEPGRSFVGVLVGVGERDQEAVPAVLRFDADFLAEIQIVDYPSSKSNTSANSPSPHPWFQSEAGIPETCAFQSVEGTLTLNGLNLWRRTSNGRIGGATYLCGEIVIGAALRPAGDVRFSEVISRIDGLADWWDEGIVQLRPHQDEGGRVKRIEITTREDIDSIEWKQNKAQMTLELSWRSDTADQNRSWSLSQVSNLRSRFEHAQSADAHLDEHWKVKALLVLLFGKPIKYRSHAVTVNIKNPERNEATEPGWAAASAELAFLTRRTVRDFGTKVEPFDGPYACVLNLRQVGATGLAEWSRMWGEGWERFTAPTIAVLGRDEPFADDSVLAAGIFLDAWGKSQVKVEGEQLTYGQAGKSKSPTFATYVYRALIHSEAEWSRTGFSPVELSVGIRDVYTAVKHAEKRQPHVDALVLSADIMMWLVRIIVARGVAVSQDDVKQFLTSWWFNSQLQTLNLLNLEADHSGRFLPVDGLRVQPSPNNS